jgi:hypothetical protein
MTFNVANFSAKINRFGLARSNLFVATIDPPLESKSILNLPINSDLIFFCKSAAIPGMDINTVDVKPQGWGKIEKRPTEFVKNNLVLTFMVDSNFAVKQFFHRWIQSVVNYNGMNGTLSEDSQGKLPFELDYKDNYSGRIEIVVYADNSEKSTARTYTYQFDGAFPVSIGSVETAWENQAEIMVITVAFAYDAMHVSGMQETTLSNRSTSPDFSQSSTGGALGGILSGATGGLVQQIFGSTLPTSIQDAVNRITAPLNNALSSINSVRTTTSNFLSSLNRKY